MKTPANINYFVYYREAYLAAIRGIAKPGSMSEDVTVRIVDEIADGIAKKYAERMEELNPTNTDKDIAL